MHERPQNNEVYFFSSCIPTWNFQVLSVKSTLDFPHTLYTIHISCNFFLAPVCSAYCVLSPQIQLWQIDVWIAQNEIMISASKANAKQKWGKKIFRTHEQWTTNTLKDSRLLWYFLIAIQPNTSSITYRCTNWPNGCFSISINMIINCSETTTTVN